VKKNAVSAFEEGGLVEHSDAIQEFAGHFVLGVEASADDECSRPVMLELSAQSLLIVLVGEVEVNAVFCFFLFCDARFLIGKDGCVNPFQYFRFCIPYLQNAFEIIVRFACNIHRDMFRHVLCLPQTVYKCWHE